MNKPIIVGIALGVAAMAMSMSMYLKPFESHYKVAKGSTLDKAACTICHATAKGGKLNGYGTDLQAVMKADKSKKLTPAMLIKIEAKDSDGDGVKNGEEIKKDKNPGVK